ncbi:ETS homologous factor-like isoform X1 [Schistocerca americana]|uniref:ETS homologous factor-like isoform X1 n=1 Tax=Schistocerca americana TaxID=7009 RepID=UPI001F4F75D5|nr:ETS homologous factor-like isoform X1 [Schistocerca americana]
MDCPLTEPLYQTLPDPDYSELVPQSAYTDHYSWHSDWPSQHIYEEEPVSFYSRVFGYENDQSYELRQPVVFAPTPPPDIMDKCIQDLSKVPAHEWQNKCVKSWTVFDIMNWVIHEIKSRGQNYENSCMKSFRISAEVLCTLTKQEFEQLDPNFGAMLYDALQKYKNMTPPYVPNVALPPIENIRRDMFTEPEPTVNYVEIQNRNYGSTCSDGESDSSQIGQEQKPKRKPVRSPPSRGIRRKQEKKTGRLWEFIRDLLKNREYCPSLICWENYDEGVFRFVRSDKVAELWGTIKENPRMTYEKLSRAMRNYYASGILEPVPKTGQYPKRLVYKFGHAAIWKTAKDYGGNDRVLLQEQSSSSCSGEAARVQIWPFSYELADT